MPEARLQKAEAGLLCEWRRERELARSSGAGLCGNIDESVPRSIQTVRVALAAQGIRWERSLGVVRSAWLQLVQGKVMKSRQMKVNAKLIWLVANMGCSAQIRLDSRPIRTDRVPVAESRLGTPTGARNETFGGFSQLVRSVARLGPWS